MFNNGMIEGIKDIITNFKAHFILYMEPTHVSVKEYETEYQYNWPQTSKVMYWNRVILTHIELVILHGKDL